MLRSWHWTDEPIPATRERKRTFDNYSNYRTPGGLWLPSDLTIDDTTDIPPDWSGAYEFRHRKLNGILQAFVGDETDTGNRAMWGMRLAHNPNAWLNIKALGIDNPIQPIRNGNKLTYSDLWTNADFELELIRHAIRKTIILKAPGHQNSFRFALRYPDNWTHQIIDDILYVSNAQGTVIFQTKPLWAFDSTPINKKPIRLNLVAGQPITVGLKTFPTIRIVLNQIDLSNAIYPIHVDPTTTISGTTDIQDTWLQNDTGSGTNANWGGATTIRLGTFSDSYGSNASRTLFRIATASIPAGTITNFTMTIKNSATINATQAHEIYIIVDANSNWVEGTGNGSTQVGSCCYNRKIYNTTTWTGGAGIGSGGYDTDASPPTISLTNGTSANTAHTATLKTAWATAWRDATRQNSGILIASAMASLATDTFHSTEAASNQPTFEIAYTTGSPVSFDGKTFFTGGW
jgi:hypothetical protein